MRTQSIDTPPDIESLVVERLRALGIEGRLEAFLDLQRTAEALALAGVRLRHGEITDSEASLRLAALRLDRETMIRVFGWDPEVVGY